MSPPDRSDQGVRELTSALNCMWFLAQTGLDPVRKPPDRSDPGVRGLTSVLNCTWFLAQTGLDPARKPPDRSDPGVRGLASVLNGCPPFDKVRPPGFKVRWSNPRVAPIRGLDHLTLNPAGLCFRFPWVLNARQLQIKSGGQTPGSERSGG